MTDSEKLDLLLVEMQEMKTEVKEINHRVAQLEAGQAELKRKWTGWQWKRPKRKVSCSKLTERLRMSME